MNKIIVSVAIVMGLLVSVGFGEEKRELDPRLITKTGEWWESSGTDLYHKLFFYSSGKYVYININNEAIQHGDTTRGTWYTRNDTLFQTTPYGFKKGKYSIEKNEFTGNPEFLHEDMPSFLKRRTK